MRTHSEIAVIESASIVDAGQAKPLRPRSQIVAAALFASAAAMAILVLLSLYISARSGALAANTEWLSPGSIPLTGPNIALFTLLLSVPVMAWAQYSIATDDRQNLWVAFGIVLLLGVAFINAESFILTNITLSHEAGKSIGITESIPGLLIFTIVGLHIAMVVGGLGSIILTGIRSLGGQMSSRDRDGISAVALYWYVTVAVFIVLWYAIYVTK